MMAMASKETGVGMVLIVAMLTLIHGYRNGVESQQTGEPRCYYPDGNVGICKSIVDCPDALQNMLSGIIPTMCTFGEYKQTICCRYDGGRDNGIYYPEPHKPTVWATAPTRRPASPYRSTSYRPSTTHIYRPTSPTPQRRPSPPQQRPQTRPYYEKTHYLKCQEYSRRLQKVVEAIPLVLDPMPIRFEISRCYSEGLPLIVGGENTTHGEFPHMAALGYRTDDIRGINWACGGSLISERFILTAAHCIHTRFGPPIVARLGDLNLYRDDDGAQPEDYEVVKYFVHPSYHAQSHYHDIALIKLNRNVSFSSEIHPACLYYEKTVNRNMVTATGWGAVGYGDDKSESLLKVHLQIIPNEECGNHYVKHGGSKLRDGITSNQLCAGDRRGGKDTCQGDSGGPLQVELRGVKCMFGIIGVTSFGPTACGFTTPGVYTKVAPYIDWIESHVWPDTNF